VTFVGWQNGYGQLIVIDHGGGLTSRYGHLSHIDVSQGQTIERGQFIGRVGSTGRSTGPHLHYEIRINDTPVDPLQYLLISANR
jgi:murein DD-endopeptidase MepM/ murein hydrolase activator NlpD